MERWKEVKGYEGNYEVSNKGRIRSVDRVTISKIGHPMTFKGKLKTEKVNKCGYSIQTFYKNGVGTTKTVHRIVAEAFLPKKRGKGIINHKNGIKTDNRVENLEWCDYSHNTKHAFDSKLREAKRGEESSRAVINKKDAKEIKRLYKKGGLYQYEIAELFGISQPHVSAIVNGRYWGEEE